ncbi:MAG: right-handed parallel beta-helix repeat-containing protein [candidate division Zixibacteria bacterium]|nr:right-handed parallel beta-helix repeat-containing protein [candidate division Zixibacteria bacterium]
MRKNINYLIAFSIILLVLTGCNNNNSPIVSIISPVENESVPAGEVEIIAIITDEQGVVDDKLYIDDEYYSRHTEVCSDTYFFSWDASGEVYGSEHKITVYGYDEANETGIDWVNSVFVGGEGGEGTEHYGEITSSETWSSAGNPHIIGSDIEISNGARLEIGLGCIVKFAYGTSIMVEEGSIEAYGSFDSPIMFTSVSENPSPGNWQFIGFSGGNYTGGHFSHCTFEYGGMGMVGATVYAEDSAYLGISNCTIWKSAGAGIRTSNYGHIVYYDFAGNTITECATYPVRTSAEGAYGVNIENIYTGNTIDAIYVDGGYITQKMTWDKLEIPYIVDQPVYCGDYEGSGVLVLDPGVTLKMGSAGGIFIGAYNQGGFIADGSEEQINITSLNDTPAPGDWNKIYFYENCKDDSCIIRNCKIEYGGNQSDGMIRIRNAIPLIMDDSIGYSGSYGIYLEGSSPSTSQLLNDNTFYNNTSGSIYGP